MYESRYGDGIAYVGRATGNPTLWTRQWEHYTHLIGGQYTIPGQARRNDRKWGMGYNSKIAAEFQETVDTVFDEERFVELVRDAMQFARQVSIYLCKLPYEYVHAVERQLLYELQPFDTVRGTKTPPPQLLPLVHMTPAWLTDAVRLKIRATVKFAEPH
jgi:hypothetical protein